VKPMKSWYQLYARVLAANHFCRVVEQLVSAQAVSLASVSVVRALIVSQVSVIPGLSQPGSPPEFIGLCLAVAAIIMIFVVIESYS
jgi:hypothetical protein